MPLIRRLADLGKIEEICSCGCKLHAVYYSSHNLDGDLREMMWLKHCYSCERGVVGLDEETFDRVRGMLPTANFKVYEIIHQPDACYLAVNRCNCGGETTDSRVLMGSPALGRVKVPIERCLKCGTTKIIVRPHDRWCKTPTAEFR